MRLTIWRILSAIAILVAVTAVWYLFVLNEVLRTSNVRLADQKRSIERELGAVYKQKQALETAFAEANKEKESLVDKISGYEARIEEMNYENEARIKDQEANLNRVRALLAEKEKELPAKDAEIALLKEALKKSKYKIRQLTKRLMNGRPAGLVKSSPVVLQPLAALPEPVTAAAEPGRVSGKVLEINHDYGFLVVDVGTRAGVKKGDVLFVFQKRKLLGKIVVERASGDICVAKILYKSLADAVQKGDSVSN